MQFKMTFEVPAASIALAIAGFVKENRNVKDLELVEMAPGSTPPKQGYVQFSATRMVDGRMSVVQQSDPEKTHYSLLVVHINGSSVVAQQVQDFPITDECDVYAAKATALSRAALMSMDLGYPVRAV